MASFVLQLAVSVILARLLSPADFGLLSAALVVVYFASMFSTLGFGSALIQRQELTPRHVNTGFITNLIFTVLMGGIVFIGAPLLANFYRLPELTPILRVLSLLFPIRGFVGLSDALIKRSEKFRRLAGINIISFLVGYGFVGIILALLDFGVWALVVATLAQAILNSLLLFLSVPHSLRLQFDLPAFKELWRFGGGLTVANFVNYLARQGDNFVVGRWLGAEALGYYGKAFSLMLLPTSQFTSVIDQVLFPTLSKVQNETKKLTLTYEYGISSIALILMPLSVISFVLAPELIRVVYGANWSPAIRPFQILCLGMFFRSAYKICASIILACGQVYSFTIIQTVYALLIVIGAIIGRNWGIEGVALSTSFGIFVNYILLTRSSLTITGLNWRKFLALHIPGTILSIIVFLIVYLTASSLRSASISDPLIIIITSFAMGIVLLGTFWKPRFLGSYGIQVKDLFMQLLIKRLARGTN
jgi:PST family polysaccharide transporter